jgi:hypothetical protein
LLCGGAHARVQQSYALMRGMSTGEQRVGCSAGEARSSRTHAPPNGKKGEAQNRNTWKRLRLILSVGVENMLSEPFRYLLNLRLTEDEFDINLRPLSCRNSR